MDKPAEKQRARQESLNELIQLNKDLGSVVAHVLQQDSKDQDLLELDMIRTRLRTLIHAYADFMTVLPHLSSIIRSLKKRYRL